MICRRNGRHDLTVQNLNQQHTMNEKNTNEPRVADTSSGSEGGKYILPPPEDDGRAAIMCRDDSRRLIESSIETFGSEASTNPGEGVLA
jgi:hypothetical protein